MATWATRDRAEAAEARVAELEAENAHLRAQVARLSVPTLGWTDLDADYAPPVPTRGMDRIAKRALAERAKR